MQYHLLIYQIIFALLPLTSISIESIQDENPVAWHVFNDKLSDNRFYIKIEAKIEEDWVIYSMNTPLGGPIPTEIEFSSDDGVSLVKKTREVKKPISGFDKFFDLKVLKLENEALYVQEVKTDKDNSVIRGNIKYMACNGVKCLAPTDVPFVVLLN